MHPTLHLPRARPRLRIPPRRRLLVVRAIGQFPCPIFVQGISIEAVQSAFNIRLCTYCELFAVPQHQSHSHSGRPRRSRSKSPQSARHLRSLEPRATSWPKPPLPGIGLSALRQPPFVAISLGRFWRPCPGTKNFCVRQGRKQCQSRLARHPKTALALKSQTRCGCMLRL